MGSLYDEKCLCQPGSLHMGKETQSGLQNLYDYLSGRTADLDRCLDFIESRQEEIVGNDIGFILDIPATTQEISRQLWALLSALVKGDDGARRTLTDLRQRHPPQRV